MKLTPNVTTKRKAVLHKDSDDDGDDDAQGICKRMRLTKNVEGLLDFRKELVTPQEEPASGQTRDTPQTVSGSCKDPDESLHHNEQPKRSRQKRYETSTESVDRNKTIIPEDPEKLVEASHHERTSREKESYDSAVVKMYNMEQKAKKDDSEVSFENVEDSSVASPHHESIDRLFLDYKSSVTTDSVPYPDPWFCLGESDTHGAGGDQNHHSANRTVSKAPQDGPFMPKPTQSNKQLSLSQESSSVTLPSTSDSPGQLGHLADEIKHIKAGLKEMRRTRDRMLMQSEDLHSSLPDLTFPNELSSFPEEYSTELQQDFGSSFPLLPTLGQKDGRHNEDDCSSVVLGFRSPQLMKSFHESLGDDAINLLKSLMMME